jgi:hypothetical protein
MAEVLQRALDPAVAPRRILAGQADRELADLRDVGSRVVP